MENKMPTVKRELVAEMLKNIGGSIFSAEFIKKDGTPRQGAFRLRVMRGVLGEAASEAGKKAVATRKENNPHLINVFDMNKVDINQSPELIKGCWRTLNIETLNWIKVNGETFTVVD
jgi:hypothetical protein